MKSKKMFFKSVIVAVGAVTVMGLIYPRLKNR